MTTEEMLSKIIEAQVRGGYAEFEVLLNTDKKEEVNGLCSGDLEISKDSKWVGWSNACLRVETVLRILLDPQGLRAIRSDDLFPYDYKWMAEHILRSWLSNPEGNVKGAIKIAYDLLPNQ